MYQKFRYDACVGTGPDVFRLSGYLEDTGGASLKEAMGSRLDDGQTLYVYDFQGVELISSPGVAALLDIVSQVVDDYGGKVAMFGLDSHHLAVLEMSGMFFLAEHVANEEDAVQLLNSAQEL